jgi:hypothetical protein
MSKFNKLVKKLEGKGESAKEAKGVAAIAGRKKYGSRGMAKKAALGRKRAK